MIQAGRRTFKDVAAVVVDARVLCADLGEGAEDGGVDFRGDELGVVVVGRVVGLVVFVVVAKLEVLAVLVLDCRAWCEGTGGQRHTHAAASDGQRR